jgi:hypothetical protein
MASLLPPGAPERSKSLSSSVNTVPDKETMASPTDTPTFNGTMPSRKDTMETQSEAPFKFQAGKMITLSSTDHAFVCHVIGATSDDEANSLLHPKSILYPPKGLPDGLYKDVIRSRVVCTYQYYFCMVWFNVSLFAQLILGAAITALASASKGGETSITILAAINTVNAGILALMHNSGLPDRYKNDWTEYERVELYIKELIAGGIVREDVSREDVIADCYERYAKAKETVSKNKPASYTATAIVAPASRPKK